MMLLFISVSNPIYIRFATQSHREKRSRSLSPTVAMLKQVTQIVSYPISYPTYRIPKKMPRAITNITMCSTFIIYFPFNKKIIQQTLKPLDPKITRNKERKDP
jgi:uncharacterized membrane protein